MSDLIPKDPRSAKDRGNAVCAVMLIDSGSYQAFEDKHAWAHAEQLTGDVCKILSLHELVYCVASSKDHDLSMCLCKLMT